MLPADRPRRHARPARLDASGITIETGLREVASGAEMVQVTSTEYEMLEYLVRHAGRIVPRDELMAVVCQREASSLDRSLDVHVSRLRRKLADRASTIRTVRGVGYMFGVARRPTSPSHFLRRSTRPNPPHDVQISRGLLMPGTFAGAFHRGQVSCGSLPSYPDGSAPWPGRPGSPSHCDEETPMRDVSARTAIGSTFVARWRCLRCLPRGSRRAARRGSTARGC